jgi:hypothetical protein
LRRLGRFSFSGKLCCMELVMYFSLLIIFPPVLFAHLALFPLP